MPAIKDPIPVVLPPPTPPAGATREWWRDPRLPFGALLAIYAILGCTILRFNRNPWQMALTVGGCMALDAVFHRVIRGRWIMPWSAAISGLSLTLLLNYSHTEFLLALPVFLTVGSKYLFTWQGRHHFNPSLFGVVGSLWLGGDIITTAPSYQWGGWYSTAFLIAAAVCMFLWRIDRMVLVGSFLGFYLLQILLRAWIIRWHLPPEALVLGTLSSAPFALFAFYMITDPRTSPPGKRAQFYVGLAIMLVDLSFHLVDEPLHLFLRGFCRGCRALHLAARKQALAGKGDFSRLWSAPMPRSATTLAVRRRADRAFLPALVAAGIGGAGSGFRVGRNPGVAIGHHGAAVPADSRAGRSASAAHCQVGALGGRFRGGRRFRWRWPSRSLPYAAAEKLRKIASRSIAIWAGCASSACACRRWMRSMADPKKYGLATCAMFVDYDNDGDQDLFLSFAYGHCMLLKNMLRETGRAEFVDVTHEVGLDEYTVSVAANWFDFDRDGRLDLFIANAFNPLLTEYQPPRRFNVFDLPAAEFPGDRRMLSIMHASWDNACNGGGNALWHNTAARFAKYDARALGMPETHWSLAVGTGDLNNDGWTDLYIANDFGPDDLYLNEGGKHLRRIEGSMWGTVGRDTYKGMNAAIGDIDRNGWLDVYVSNVHAPLQAEGSLLWMTYPPSAKRGPLARLWAGLGGNSATPRDGLVVPTFRDEATARGILNEHRFGWGGALGDINLDGWLDLAQANGMVDDSYDRRFPEPRSYWYTNEKLMRAGPEIHKYADMWGDLRGYEINGRETNRIYLARGQGNRVHFADAAPRLGLTGESPSRGMLLADFENNGSLDLLVTHQFAPPQLYRNTRTDAGTAHWVGFALEGNGTTNNRDAAGSRIWIKYLEEGKPVEQWREITITNSFAAQGDRRALRPWRLPRRCRGGSLMEWRPARAARPLCAKELSRHPPAMNAPAKLLREMSPADFTRRFMPEALTPLFHTRIYAELTADERLRYNQLHALFINEQIIFFEQALACGVCEAMLREPLPEPLRGDLVTFIKEEKRHSAAFHALNRRCAPRWYQGTRYHFIRLSPPASRALAWATRKPRLFPMFPWLMLIQEERALFFGREFLSEAGEIDEGFVAIHRMHVADEFDHVRWDEAIIDRLWPRAWGPWRKVNVLLLAWMIEEFFGTPKRAGLRVAEALVAEFPRLGARALEMRKQLLALHRDAGCREALYSPAMLPRLVQRVEGDPDFAPLRTTLFGEGRD